MSLYTRFRSACYANSAAVQSIIKWAATLARLYSGEAALALVALSPALLHVIS